MRSALHCSDLKWEVGDASKIAHMDLLTPLAIMSLAAAAIVRAAGIATASDSHCSFVQHVLTMYDPRVVLQHRYYRFPNTIRLACSELAASNPLLSSALLERAPSYARG